ncbi:MAG: type II secretion system F family protein [Firmicutes bacterium]|nr:type II secretion system F family protein [Bacillota bacterium]
MSGLKLLLLWLVFLAAASATTVVLAPSEAEVVVRKRVREWAVAAADADILERERLAEPFHRRVLLPAVRRLQAAVWARTPLGTRARIATRLRQAGQPYTPGAFVAFRLAGLLGGAAAGWLLRAALPAAGGAGGAAGGAGAWMGAALLALGAYTGSILPEMALGRRIAARQRAFRRALPDVLDLLCVSVEAGLGLDGALAKVAAKFSGPVAEEFEGYLRATRLGTSREEALGQLAERVAIPEVRNVVAAIIQAERLGASLARVLRLQADDMRLQRRQRAQEQSLRAPVKMLFPLVLFIFPTVFIVLLGPAVIRIAAALF